MKFFKSLSILTIFCLSVISCDKDVVTIDGIEITGEIEKQKITTYQYGSHTISEYALRSSSINLDDYINQKITVVGHKIGGYPVDGGPHYIEVEKIK